MSRLPVVIPSLTEQLEIVHFFEKRTSALSAAIDRAHHEIELLREYRTRLIADVVTGKLDVRDAVANLPEEPEEPETLDEADELMNDCAAMVDDLDSVPEETEA